MSAPTSDTLRVHVGGQRPTPRELAREIIDVAVSIPLFLTSPLLRRWHQRWGATKAEAMQYMPGDDLVKSCQYVITRAINIEALPEDVWPWLVQIGFSKAGFYSNDLLDNAAHPSARRIVPELQDPHVGDWVPMFNKVNDITAFRIADVRVNDYLVWAKPDSTWAWRLLPRANGTRLITRLRIRYRWSRPLEAIFSIVLNEFGDFPMMRKMLLGIRARAELLRAQVRDDPSWEPSNRKRTA